MLDVIGNLSKLPREIWEIIRGVKTLKREDADRAANLFDEIAAVLEHVAAEIGASRTPYGDCGRIKMFGTRFEQDTVGLIDRETARTMGEQLHLNYDVEREAIALAEGDAATRAAKAAKLEESAGEFRGLATMVRGRKV